MITYLWELEYEEDKAKTVKKNHKSSMDEPSDMTPVYRIVSVDTIQKHCLMIPMHSSSKFLIQVVNKKKWADAFTYA